LSLIQYRNKKLYVIKRVIRRKRKNDKSKYIVKWKNYREFIKKLIEIIEIHVLNLITHLS
jgi:hypothetical protein